MKKIIFLILLPATFLFSGAGWGQDSLNVSYIGGIYNNEFWTCLKDVQIAGNLAYVAAGNSGLRIVEVSDVSAAEEIGWVDTPDYAYSLEVVGNIAYIADYSGLAIVDVSDAYNPVLLSDYTDQAIIQELAVQGNYVYLCEQFESNRWRLSIIDTSDPEDPFWVSNLEFLNNLFSVDVEGDYAYLAMEDFLTVVDVSNPYQPDSVANTHVPMGYYWLTVAGNWVYMAFYNGFVKVADISNPLSPIVFPATAGADDPYAICYCDSFVYISGSSLYVDDASNVPNIFTAGYYNFPQLNYDLNIGYGLSYSNGIVAVAQDDEGLYFYDVNNPDSITIAGVLDRIGRITDSEITRNVAYVACGKMGLRAVDISNPASPFELGVFQTGRINNVRLSVDTLAVVTDDRFGLRIIDITDPENMWEISNLDLDADFVIDMEIDGNYVLVLKMKNEAPMTEQGLRIVDISNPYEPAIIGEIEIWPCEFMEYGNSYVYIESGPKIFIYNLSDPANPVLVDSVEENDAIRGLALTNNILCLGLQSTGVHFYDVSDPANILFLSSIYFNFVPYISACGNRVFVIDNYRELNVVDITVPTNPVIVGYHSDIYDMFDAEVLDDMVYISGWDDYSIYDLSPTGEVEPESNLAPSVFRLYPVCPNPFNLCTVIEFSLEKAGYIELSIYNIQGREVQVIGAGEWGAGKHKLIWDAHNLPSGLYFVKLNQGKEARIQKTLIIK